MELKTELRGTGSCKERTSRRDRQAATRRATTINAKCPGHPEFVEMKKRV